MSNQDLSAQIASLQKQLAQLQATALQAKSGEPATSILPLTEYPANAFEPPAEYVWVGGARPGAGQYVKVKWHPEPGDLPDFFDFFESHGAMTDDGVELPLANGMVHFTWRTGEQNYGSIELLGETEDDGKNPYEFEPVSVLIFQGDTVIPQTVDPDYGKRVKLAQMRKRERRIDFDIVTKPTMQQIWNAWTAVLPVNHVVRVVIAANKLEPKTRLRITRTEGIRP